MEKEQETLNKDVSEIQEDNRKLRLQKNEDEQKMKKMKKENSILNKTVKDQNLNIKTIEMKNIKLEKTLQD